MIQTNLMQYDHRLIGGLGGGGGLSLNMSEFRSESLRSEPSVGNSSNHHHHHQQMYVEPLQLEKLGIDSSFNNDRYLRQRSSFIGLPANQRQREGGEDDSMALDILGGDTSQLSYMFGSFNMMNPNEKSQQQQQQQQTYGGDQSRPLTSTSSPTVGSARPDSRSSGVDMSPTMSGTTMPISSSSFDSHYHFNLDGRTTDDDDMFNKAYSGNFMDSDAYVFKYDTAPPVELSFLSPSPKAPSSSVVAAAALSLSPMTSLLHRSDEDTHTTGGGGGGGGVDNKMGGITSLSSGQSSPMEAPGKLSKAKSSSRVILPVVSVPGSPQQASRENSTMILFTNGRCKSMDVIASSPTVVNSSRTASDESSCNSVLDLLNNEVMLELSDHSPSGKKKKFIKPSLLKSSSCPMNSKIHPVNWDVSSSPSMSRELSISIDSHDSL